MKHPGRLLVAAALAGLGTVLLGLLYTNHAFGPTEAEVVDWGRIAIVLGAILGVGAIVAARVRHAVVVLFLAIDCAAVAALQVPPIGLWILFHGTGISDGSPPSAFVAHWAYGLPHVAVAAAGLYAMLGLLRHARAKPNTPSTPGDY